ncbi:MAG: ABC transporter substrate-binding protein [Candidatus Rokubacteria bacterium]|nr:ABC transporter substrate-binding protein [Candidatus Rokubacteria bacterium]
MSDTTLPSIGRRDFLKAAALGAGAVTATAARPTVALAQQPKRGGVLKHMGLEPPSFDIHATVSYQTQLISSFVHRTLFKFVNGPKFGPSDFTPVPDLALKAEVSKDGRMYTITLRQGVRWENKPPVNGRELVAADVKYSLERAVKKSGYASLLGQVEGVETPDKYTVRVRLADAFAPFLHNLAEPWNGILPREVEDKMGDFKAAESLIGCGPFTLERYEPGVKAVFARNPDYFQKGLPYLDKVEWLFVKDRSTQLSLFRAGQVDIPFYDARIPRSDVGSFKKSNPTYPIVYWDWLAVRSLAMRTDKPPFNDVRVRRALSLAIDRKKWVKEYLEGQGFEDHGPVPAPMREWKLPTKDLGEGARWLEYNPVLAKKLLADAGHPNGFKAKCTHWPGYGPEYVEELELLTFSLKQIGVELQIVNEEYGNYIRGSFLGKYDETTWGPSSIFTEVDGYLYNFLKTGQPNNRSHVSDTKLDVMLDAQRRYIAKSSRKKVIDDIQRHEADQMYYVYTPYPKNLASWTPWVKNYQPKNSFDRGAQLEVVWIEK